MSADPQRQNDVSLFLIATPLHYLVSQKISKEFEKSSRKIAIPYTPAGLKISRPEEWDEVVYAPWPRFSPLPGILGRHRRLLDNIHKVSDAIGTCDRVSIHSPVFDTEAVNYFLRALPKMCSAKSLHARIIPDGLLNITRHPLTPAKLIAQNFRKLRSLVSPELNYWGFSGDRIGSDASFVDRIYTLSGFPHEYNSKKVVELPPLATYSSTAHTKTDQKKSALIVGQPLVGIGALTPDQHDLITSKISEWLLNNGFSSVHYKSHPRDPNQELRIADSLTLDIHEPLELHMSKFPYQAIIGVNSTALYLARQIYGPEIRIVSFGHDLVKFKNKDQASKATQLMDALGIQRL